MPYDSLYQCAVLATASCVGALPLFCDGSLFKMQMSIINSTGKTESVSPTAPAGNASALVGSARDILGRFRVTFYFVLASLVAVSITTTVVVNNTREMATKNFQMVMEADAVANIQHLVHMMNDSALSDQFPDEAGIPTSPSLTPLDNDLEYRPFSISEIAALDALPAQILWVQHDLDFTDAFIFDMDGKVMWATSTHDHDSSVDVNSLLASAAGGIVASKLEIETMQEGESPERDEVISEVYLPLFSEPGGSIIGVAELYTDVSGKYQNLVTSRVNEARKTVLIAMGGLFVILMGFVITADVFRSRSHLRELAQEQALAAASQAVAGELRSRITVLDAAADMILITKPDGTIQYANKAFTEKTGYTASESIGKNPRILKSGRQTAEFFANLWNDISSGRVWSGTLVNRRKDGTEYPEEMTITPVLNDEGEILQFIAIKRDISDRLQVEAERDAARDLEAEHHELLRVNEARKEFLTTVSHELRTPLTSMLAFSDVLRHNRDHNLTERQLNQLQLISNGGRQLDELIGDLLDVSRTETGRFKLEPTRFNIQETIDEVGLSIRSVFDSRGQSLMLTNLSKSTWMNGDRSRVMQVFNNLLTNSAKYSPDGTVVEMIATTEDTVLHVTIRDHGIGISREDQKQLFIPFFRVSNEETRREPGTGLGLSIAKTIVEMHSGRIELDSETGKGTTVQIWLPGVSTGSIPVGS